MALLLTAAFTFFPAASAPPQGIHAPPGTTQSGPATGPLDVEGPLDLVHLVPGTVKDLARDSAGRILYCTFERDVGRFEPGKVALTELASAKNSPSFQGQLRAVAETTTGNVAVLDTFGNVYTLPGGGGPATLVYSDLYMIADATDLIV